MKPSFNGAAGAFSPDRLLAGDHPVRTKTVTVVSGQVLARGAVLGLITASGKHKLSASASSDGSQAPVCVLLDDVDATAGDVEASAYIAGDFNANAVTLGAGHTIASVRSALEARSIYLVSPVAAE